MESYGIIYNFNYYCLKCSQVGKNQRFEIQFYGSLQVIFKIIKKFEEKNVFKVYQL